MTVNSVESGPPTGRARLATLNVWGTRGDWKARREVLAREFAELDADLVTLQECIRTDTYDQAREILGDGYHLVHQSEREPDGQGVTIASRWPVGEVAEIDLHLTPRTAGFACTSLLAEILAPEPLGRIWLVDHFPSWQLDQAYERELQAVATARVVEDRVAARPGHAIVAGDLDADPDASSIRFWTGRHALEAFSVCYRDAWASRGDPDQRAGETYVPENPLGTDWDWPFRRIDYLLVRCGRHGGPTLAVDRCARILDGPDTTASDHYGLTADLVPPPAVEEPPNG